MIDSLLGILSAGLLFEVPSGIAPGPVLVLIISETLGHGILAGTKVTCIPLLTDAPVVLASAFLFTQISKMDILLCVISLVGSVFCLIWVPKISVSPTQKYRIISPGSLTFI